MGWNPLRAAVAAVFAAAVVAAPLATASAKTLRIATQGEPGSLDPNKVTGTWENDIVGDLFEGLVTEAADVSRIPGVAESWEISEDGTVYTFHLRSDAKWSDGHPVTAEDFVFGITRILKPATAAKYAYILYPIENAEAFNQGEASADDLGLEAVDDHTLRVTLERPTPYFLDQLAHYTAYPLPKHVVTQYGDDWTQPEHMVSNGAYQLEEWVPQTEVRASKNPHFHDAGNVAIDKVIYYPTEDKNTGVNRFRAGEVDILREFPSAKYEWLKENFPEAVHVAPYLGIYYYALNTQDGAALSDPKVRKALSLAVRREVVAEKILGTGQKPAYSFVPPGVNNYEAAHLSFMDMPMDERMRRAKELMREAGYGPDNPLKLELRYNTQEDHKKVAVAVAAMWKALGVQVEMFNTEVAVHYKNLQEGNFQVGRAGWIGDFNDAHNFLNLYGTGVGQNYARYSNEAFDTRLDKAANTQDMDKRARILRKAEAIALGDHANIPIYYYVSRNLVNPKITGWQDNIEDIHRTRWVDIER
ncbi:peptide ABC transporter substrate-binding protein [Arhodomonas sp. AD133]|uniref:peptide ABC transporter substrate-binding protein n=1 Tax=Arhodomonas sp. AD133 TaxID=3415009 RepID=UPI003EB731EA